MNKKAFTLTEILIVLVVAGILLALILPNTLKAIERANVTEHENNLNSLQVSLFMCYTQERDWDNCAGIDDLTGFNFLDENPNDNPPFPGLTYTIDDNPDGVGKIACSSGGELPEGLVLKECASGSGTPEE